MTLYIFDVEDTLADGRADVLRPEVVDYFTNHFDWDNDKMAFATNQGGVGLRHWMEVGKFGDIGELPTQGEVLDRLIKLRDQIVGLEETLCPIYVSYAYQSKTTGKWAPTPKYNDMNEWSSAWRKPSPGMLLHAMAEANVAPADTVMVGDRDEDRLAAEAAGVRFILSKEFFGIPDPVEAPTPTYVFTYNPVILTEELTPDQLLGLDMEATRTRFREQVNKRMSASYPVNQVTEFVEDSGIIYFIVEPDDDRTHERWLMGSLFVNRDWLVYASAEDHAKAMANALSNTWVNHAVVLSVILNGLYGVTNVEANRLVYKYKDDAAWGRTRFVLAS